jgi:uncharacterized protein YlzI (FlbEa/FlbD family)
MDISLGPDVALRYVRKFTTNDGHEDRVNFNESLMVGWTPVTAEELPEMEAYRQPDGTLMCGGQILCKNSAEAVQEAIQEFESDALSQARKSTTDYQDMGDSSVRTHASSQVKSSVRVVRRND